jgi:hypothetical protein
MSCPRRTTPRLPEQKLHGGASHTAHEQPIGHPLLKMAVTAASFRGIEIANALAVGRPEFNNIGGRLLSIRAPGE